MQTLKKWQDDNRENTMVGTFHNEETKWQESTKVMIDSFREILEQKLFLFRRIEGISLWRINYKLNRLADRGIPKEALQKGKILISLPKKGTEENTSDAQKVLIETTIDQLEGFENLRLSQFYHYKPIYKEKKILNEVSRWIEIQVTEL